MGTEGLLEKDVKSIFVTCGDWDLKKMFGFKVFPNETNFLNFIRYFLLTGFQVKHHTFLYNIQTTLNNGSI